MKIVSLVPSLTHMLCDFGLQERIVGCTQFCVDPPSLRNTAQNIGGTKNPDLKRIAELRPTHILANLEENNPWDIEDCQKIANTLCTFPKHPADVPHVFREITGWLGIPEVGHDWANKLGSELDALQELISHRGSQNFWKNRRYLYLIWREPYMVAGEDTYIHGLMSLLGMVNVAPKSPRYPTVTVSEMQDLGVEILYFSSEPYPFRVRDIVRLQTEWSLTSSKKKAEPQCLKIDGQVFSWYGTKTIQAISVLKAMLCEKGLKSVK